jgi:endogenous inhibitor of DNA gyrase (YacG/DUF329 family)
MVCGKSFENNGYAARLYCCERCKDIQAEHKLIPEDIRKAEIKRRRDLYYETRPIKKRIRITAVRKNKELEKKVIAKEKELKYQRVCHDCGKPCIDYRCSKCWLKKRKKLGLIENVTQTESIWDGF